jgi:hypothetical protein
MWSLQSQYRYIASASMSGAVEYADMNNRQTGAFSAPFESFCRNIV